jgi:hypothetical protein
MLVHRPAYGVVLMPGAFLSQENCHREPLAGMSGNFAQLWQSPEIWGHNMDKKILPHKETAFEEINQKFRYLSLNDK